MRVLVLLAFIVCITAVRGGYSGSRHHKSIGWLRRYTPWLLNTIPRGGGPRNDFRGGSYHGHGYRHNDVHGYGLSNGNGYRHDYGHGYGYGGKHRKHYGNRYDY